MGFEWKTESLLEHYEVRSGLSKSAKEFGSGYPFLTFKDVFYNFFTPEVLGDLVQSTEKERDGCSVRRGDVFLTRTSETMHELGMSCVALRDYPEATFNGFCKRLRPKGNSALIPEFVGYFLRGPSFRQAMLSMSTMSTRASLNNEMIARLQITYPPKTTQAQIAEILLALDDRIALLRETNATLEAMAQALFKSWFVDFDPVHANAGTRAATLPAELQALFPSTFTDTAQGVVPEGWSCGLVGDVALQKKGSVNPLLAPEKLFEHYSLPAFDNSQIPVLEQGEQIKSNKTPLPPNAVLLSKLNPHIPRVWLPFEYSDNAVCSTEFLAYSPINGASKEFIYTLFTSTTFLMSLRQLVTGTSNSHQRVKPDHVLGLELVIPSKDVLVEFEKVTNPLFERIGQNRQQAQTLATLRDTLLPRLISGQLRLPDAEAALVEPGV